MSLKLEEFLEIECRQEGLDLDRRLERVKISARQIWASPRLQWFTDHGFTHSERAIDLLWQILSHLQTTPRRLSPQELYVLLAASYLHDIGMQSLKIDDKSMEQFTPRDYDFVRRKHPGRAKELILARVLRRERDEFRIDLDDTLSYLMPIALVSQGHGTDYFRSTLDEFKETPYSPAGQRLRGELLTGLLLMADELDLHEERARFPEEVRLSAVSAMHNHVHHYVVHVSVEPGYTTKERQICLSFQYPSGSEDYAELVRSWVVAKLQRQRRRVAPIMELATDGELTWAEQIIVRETYDRNNARRPMPEAAQTELRRLLVTATTVNYRQAQKALDASVLQSGKGEIICLLSKDEQAVVHMLQWLQAHCHQQGKEIVRLDLRFEPYAPEDILNHLRTKLLPEAPTSEGHAQSLSAGQLTDFVRKLKPVLLGRSVVLVLQNIDHAESGTASWIADELFGTHQRNALALPVVVTASSLPEYLSQVSSRWTVLVLDNLGVDQISDYLQDYGLRPEDAQEKAEEIYGTSSGGRPQGVLFALRRLQAKEARLIV